MSRVLAWVILFSLEFAGAAAQAQTAELQRAAYLSSRTSPRTTLKTAADPHTSTHPDAVVPGYLSSRGLPPVEGQFRFTGSALVFQPNDEAAADALSAWQPSMFSLAYVDDDGNRRHYIFRVDAGVFETDVPGPLLDIADTTRLWRESTSTGWPGDRPLANAADSAALWRATREVSAGPYADSLYALLGRPRAAVGLIGARGRKAGRLGEYIASTDSLALDPSRIAGEAQLRHALAHELGHRWQRRARSQLARLWVGVAPIRDSKRYGYGDIAEHQAEAIAFAISFLQATASTQEPVASSLRLLDHYELLVPGTRQMVRYFSLQPLYRQHPLRRKLTISAAAPSTTR